MKFFFADLGQILKFEVLFNARPHVLWIGHFNKNFLQVDQLSIVLVTVKLQNWNAIVYLQSKTLGFIVDQNNIFELPVLNYPQILDHFAPLGLKAMLTAQKILNYFSWRVKLSDDCLGIGFGGCSEHIDIVEFGNIF